MKLVCYFLILNTFGLGDLFLVQSLSLPLSGTAQHNPSHKNLLLDGIIVMTQLKINT